jgi:Tfp pilus assembly protein PilO
MAARNDKPKGLLPQHKILLFIISLGLIAGGFYYLVILPLDEQIGSELVQMNQARTQLKQVSDFRGEEQLLELREQFLELNRLIERNRDLMPIEDEKTDLTRLQTDMMAELLEASRQAGIEVRTKTPQDVQNLPTYRVLPIYFKVEGSYAQLVKFFLLLSRVEDRVAAADLAGAGMGVGDSVLGARKHGRMYNVRDLKIAPSKAAASARDKQDSTSASARVGLPTSTLEASFTVQGFLGIRPRKEVAAAEPGETGKAQAAGAKVAKPK